MSETSRFSLRSPSGFSSSTPFNTGAGVLLSVPRDASAESPDNTVNNTAAAVNKREDSGLGSFGSESSDMSADRDSRPSYADPPNAAAAAVSQEVFPPVTCLPRVFTVVYLGEYVLDRRYTQSMLPWVMDAVKRRETGRVIQLTVEPNILRASVRGAPVGTSRGASSALRGTGVPFRGGVVSAREVFEHRLQTMSRFARTVHDRKCFSYLVRVSPDQPYVCHVFHTADEATIQQLFDTIQSAISLSSHGRLAGRTSSADDQMTDSVIEGTFSPNGGKGGVHSSNIRNYEVLYVGKVLVSTKNAPPTFIDDAVKKFNEFGRLCREHEPVTKVGTDGDSHVMSSDVSSLTKKLLMSADIAIGEDNGQRARDVTGALMNSSSALILESSEDEHKKKQSWSEDMKMKVITGSVNQTVDSALHAANDKRVYKRADVESYAAGGNVGGEAGGRREEREMSTGNGSEKNRTMLLQVGDSEISLISLDRKSVIFDRKFKDISFCSQGIVNPEHFGFISRDPESENFICYVFQCASEMVVEEVMLTLKQAFQSAFQSASKSLVVCELCPMHQLHKLCQDIDKLEPVQVNSVLQERIERLNNQHQSTILAKIQAGNPQTVQDSNELIVIALLELSQQEQKKHVHIGDIGRSQSTGKFEADNSLEDNEIVGEKIWSNKRRPIMEELYIDAVNPTRLLVENSATEVRQRRHSTPNNPEHPLRSRTHHPTTLIAHDSDIAEDPRIPHSKSSIEPTASESSTKMFRHVVSDDGRGIISLDGDVGNGGGERRSGEGIGVQQHLPHNSPARSMFVKVGNRVDTASIKQQHEQQQQRIGPDVSRGAGGRSYSTSSYPLSLATSSGLSRTRAVGSRSWRLSLLNSVVSSSSLDETTTSVDISSRQTGRDTRSGIEVGVALGGSRVKEMWKKAILETLLLIRMNKENRIHEEDRREYSIEAAANGGVGGVSGVVGGGSVQRLDYEEITPCLKEVTKVWQQMLTDPDRPNKLFDMDTLTDAVKDGVPRVCRGEIWQLLVEQHRLYRRSTPVDEPPTGEEFSYKNLLKQLTLHQHAILIDLGRTFPGHPYFSTQLGAGQLSLFNLLKAYSLLDKDVGYCQGISFVAGIILMHVAEEKAFEILKYMMFNLGFRRQYRPDMVPLQIQMYQLSRLLHDTHKDLYEHFEENEIAPTLYAAPWLLTIFASQFPLGFVGRVFDLIFLQGMEVVMKVAVVLLANHKELIKQCSGFEAVVEFLKTTLPEMGIIQMERIINQVFTMDITKSLEAYEVEYHVLQEEMLLLRVNSSSVSPRGSTETVSHTTGMGSSVAGGQRNNDSVDHASSSTTANERMRRLQVTNEGLRRQKMELLEQLQIARRQTTTLEERLEVYMANESAHQSRIRTLELERTALLDAITQLRSLLPPHLINSQQQPHTSSAQPQPGDKAEMLDPASHPSNQSEHSLDRRLDTGSRCLEQGLMIVANANNDEDHLLDAMTSSYACDNNERDDKH